MIQFCCRFAPAPGKPFSVLIALPTEIRDALASQKGEISLHARLHRAPGEIAELLAVAMTVEDGGL